MLKRIGEQLWDWMMDERPRVHLPVISVMVLSVAFIMSMTISWASASYQIKLIEGTRANAAEACRSPAALRAYQCRASKNNENILSWQTLRRYSYIGHVLVSAQWDEMEFIEIPGTTCPEPP